MQNTNFKDGMTETPSYSTYVMCDFYLIKIDLFLCWIKRYLQTCRVRTLRICLFTFHLFELSISVEAEFFSHVK